MPITAAQKTSAEQQQRTAAIDTSLRVRLIAGPGTGKSHCIELRVAQLLSNGCAPNKVHVISFTRATCTELRERLERYCSNLSCAQAASQVHVSTMHALALRILRQANLLSSYPTSPIMLDGWEQTHVYDKELASAIGCSPTRASEIRLAHDAQWQTLNPQSVSQAQITPAEIQVFNVFHATRTNLYSCVLPGEVIFKCVENMNYGALQPAQLPPVEHLIVDEYQDLNACDQEFIRLIWTATGAVLFIAGDDDQSIYAFRHANPDGIVQFPAVYPSSSTHILTDCFRCTPSILNPASRLIAFNPNRVPKNMTALYGSASPSVQGRLLVWSFQTAEDEARAIAVSCQQLQTSGMSEREDEIVILLSNRRVQLDLISQELGNLGLSFEPPRGDSLVNEEEAIRAVYAVLRIAKDNESGQPDYPSHRDILGVLDGVGLGTAKAVADTCITNNQNFRDLFYLPQCPPWLTSRTAAATQRVMSIVQTVGSWNMTDTLGTRAADIQNVITVTIFNGANAGKAATIWNGLVNSLPQLMTLDELLNFLATDTESGQQAILDLVNQRTASSQGQAVMPTPKRIRLLTMHGAKGLSGKVVFIPGAEQGIMPNAKSLQATGLLIEQRRLFYVSLTRAMACCIISHAAQHTGLAAAVLAQRHVARLPRTQFLNEMGLSSVNRSAGLSPSEAATIVSDISAL